MRYLHSVDMERLLDSTLDEAAALRDLSQASSSSVVEGGLPLALASQLEQRDPDALRKWATESTRTSDSLGALFASVPLDVDLLTLTPKARV